MMMNWRVRCTVKNALRADFEQWMANYLIGQYEVATEQNGIVTINLEFIGDRLPLREAFDVIKMEFQ
jgi:hypothetical protein